jgi:hypothetical protein
MIKKARIITFRGRVDKLLEISQVFSRILQGEVLDVGCDQKNLLEWVTGKYVGVDIGGNPDIFVNLEKGLPFPDRSFDTVVALDVLEHLDNIHFAFDEICRVSRSYVIVGFPNMFEWRFRLMFLLGKNLSGKYLLDSNPPEDRHKWLFGLNEAKQFLTGRGSINSFSIIDEVLGYYAYRKAIPKIIISIGKLISPIGSSLFAYHYCAIMQKIPRT